MNAPAHQTHQSSHLVAPKYRPDIDGLRAVAVLAVVVYHAFPSLLPSGFIGVDVFFVISGFLISTIIFESAQRGAFSIAEFYARRIKRIFPALLLVLIGCLVGGWFFLLSAEYASLGKHVAAGAGFASNILLWTESDYFDRGAELKPLLHLWSLGIEEQYYLVWPLLVVALWRRSAKLFLPIAALFGISFVLNIIQTEGHNTLGFYSPLTRFWELLTGSALAYLTFRARAPHHGEPSSSPLPHNAILSERYALVRAFLGAALLVCGLLTITKELTFPGWWALLPTFGTALLISAGPSSLINRLILSQRALVGIGLISFPLYLWHWPLLSFARIVGGESISPQLRALLVALATALAWLTFLVVERPIRFGGRSRLKVFLLALLMALTGAVGYAVSLKQGFPERFPPVIRGLVGNIDFSWGDHVRAPNCLLQTQESLVHGEGCIESARPLVALWGDSHAAALYPGLKKLQESRSFGIAQLTEAGCPPLFNLENIPWRPNCNIVNQAVFEKFVEAHVDTIILHAAWIKQQYPLTNEELAEKLRGTIRIIKQRLPHTTVIVIGPAPRWNESPQKTIYLEWQKTLDKTKEPPILQPAKILSDAEHALETVSQEEGARYLSASQALCEGDRCVSRVGSKPTDMIATDEAHISKAGAEYLIEKLGPRLLP